jgi:3-oxosteroid 1-dehydrogenase
MGASLSWEKGARVPPQAVLECDLAVFGSGVGGLSAALAAADAGLSVIVCEKDTLIGGGSALAHGGLWAACNHVAEAKGLTDSREEGLAYMRFVAGHAGDEDLMRAYVDSAPQALRYFESRGVRMRIIPNFSDHYFPVAPGSKKDGRSLEPFPVSLRELGEWGDKIRDSQIDPHRASVSEFISWGGLVNRKNRDFALVAEREKEGVRTCGAALVIYLLKGLLDRGVKPYLETAVTELLADDGKIVGARTSVGQEIRARRGVVLATGGWEGDEELCRNFEGLPDWRSPFPSAISGDGYRLAAGVGAATALTRENLAVMVGMPVPARLGDSEPEFRLTQIFECQCPHTIIVNADGERFSDESYFQDTIAALRQYDVWGRRYKNLPCFLVFDSQYVENFGFCGGEVGELPPQWVSRGDSLAELAEALGIARDGLASAIERFNGFARDGVDRDFHRGEKKWTQADRDQIRGGGPNRALGSLEKAPFYGVRLYPAAFVPSGGVRTDVNGQVIDTQGRQILNLFAIGNTAAHLEYGIGYQAGYSLTAAMTFGYRLARHLAGSNA